MDRALGRVVAVAALRSSAELNGLIPVLKQHCNEQEYASMRDTIADASLAISQIVLRRVFEEFPDLEAELELHYNNFGRPG